MNKLERIKKNKAFSRLNERINFYLEVTVFLSEKKKYRKMR
jgi:hypothetical protein